MPQAQTQYVKVLDKGLITLPKSWRTAFNLNKGSVLQVRKMNRSIVIEPVTLTTTKTKVPYRIYNAAELKCFVKADQLR